MITTISEMYKEALSTNVFTTMNARITNCKSGITVSSSLVNTCNESRDALDKLTKRERLISQLVAEGFMSKEIAAAIGISQKTVEKHRVTASKKLGVKNTAGLTRIILYASLLDENHI